MDDFHGKHVGPKTIASEAIHKMKYRGEGESFRESANRVASALKDSTEHYHALREILMEMRFLPAGRVQAAMGSPKNVTAFNCYYSGIILDSYVGDGIWENDKGSIMRRAWESAATMRMGGGIGYNFSTLRPSGSLIKKLGSFTKGPLSFMPIYDSICLATASAGHRRGAQMAVLDISHPDIELFIHAKQNDHALQGFNVSVGVTDRFMECLYTGKPFPLEFGGQVYREVDPNALWEIIMRSTWDFAEPGVLYLDTINKMNNLWYCETITGTNPCGEQPLPPFGACLLGSFNLTKYMYRDKTGQFSFNWNQLSDDIPHVVRAMDNVTDRTTYPLPEQRLEALSKRRMGLGITGLANAAEAMGYPYGSTEFVQFEAAVLDYIRDWSYHASMHLAREKAPFPYYDEKYNNGKFIKTLHPDIQADIKQFGIRNSHLTSIAPTGTISFCADNVSSGIEPVFSYKTDRVVQMFDGPQIVSVDDYGVREFGVKGKRVEDVTVDEHLAVLIAAATRVDSAVSKTCNLTGKTPWEDFKNIYIRAWEGGVKGVTTFNIDGKRTAMMVSKDAEESETVACKYDPNTGERSCE